METRQLDFSILCIAVSDLTTMPPTLRRRRRAAGDVSSTTFTSSSTSTSLSSRERDRERGRDRDRDSDESRDREDDTRGLLAAEQSQMRGPLYDFFVRSVE